MVWYEKMLVEGVKDLMIDCEGNRRVDEKGGEEKCDVRCGL